MDDMELRKKELIIDYKKMNANEKEKTIDFDITKDDTGEIPEFEERKRRKKT
jgi:hypothetical protein